MDIVYDIKIASRMTQFDNIWTAFCCPCGHYLGSILLSIWPLFGQHFAVHLACVWSPRPVPNTRSHGSPLAPILPGHGHDFHSPGWPDLRGGFPDLRPGWPQMRPQTKPGWPDLRPSWPDLRPGRPDLMPGWADLRHGWPDLRPGWTGSRPG